MKVRVIADVTVCFDAEIPDKEIQGYKSGRNFDLFQTVWDRWHTLEENVSLPFELCTEGCEIFSIVNADTDETIYQA